MWQQSQRLEWFVYQPRNAKGYRQPPETKRDKKAPSPGAFRGSRPLPTLRLGTSSLQNDERMHFFCLKPPSLGYLVTAAPGHWNTGSPLTRTSSLGAASPEAPDTTSCFLCSDIWQGFFKSILQHLPIHHRNIPEITNSQEMYRFTTFGFIHISRRID